MQRIGAFKSAGDQLLRTDMAPEQRQQLQALLDSVYAGFLSSVAAARGKTEAQVGLAFWDVRRHAADCDRSCASCLGRRAGLLCNVPRSSLAAPRQQTAALRPADQRVCTTGPPLSTKGTSVPHPQAHGGGCAALLGTPIATGHAAQVAELLDQAYFDADQYLEGGWVDSLAYEWQVLQELEQRQKVKEDEDLKQVR